MSIKPFLCVFGRWLLQLNNDVKEIMTFAVHLQLLLSKCQEKIFYYLALFHGEFYITMTSIHLF